MGFDIDYSSDGSKFRATLSGEPGSYNTDLSTIAMAGQEWPHVQNVRQGWPTIVTRSAFPRGAGGYTVNSGASGPDLISYSGTLRSGATYDVYYGFDSANSGTIYAQYDMAANGSVIKASESIATRTFYPWAMADDDLILATSATSGVAFAGTVHAQYTGTATLSAGSPTVTSISSSLTAGQQAQMVGSYLVCTADSASTLAVYKIISVDSATQVTLDRNYNGSGAGAGVAIRISPYEPTRFTSGIFAASTSLARPSKVCVAWNRLLVSTGVTQQTGSITRRLRWSGLIGSTEGTTPFTGMWAFDTNGYLDLPASVGGGGVRDFQVWGGKVAVLCSSRLVILTGSPTFAGIGDLDASEMYPIDYVGTWASVKTPRGVFFLDSNEGLMLWDGSGAPRAVGSRRVASHIITTGYDELSYYRDTVILNVDGAMLFYHIPSDSFQKISQSVTLYHPQAGCRLYRNENLVAIASTGHVVKLNYPLDDDSTDLNVDGDSAAIALKVRTPYIGDPAARLRPERMYVTYTLDDGSPLQYPWLKVTVTTGLPSTPLGTSDSHPAGNTFTTTSEDLPSTSSGLGTDRYVTKRIELRGIEPGEMLQVTVESQNKAYRCEVARIVIEGSVEGDAGSVIL